MPILDFLNTYLIAPALPVCLLCAGLWYGVALRFFHLRRPGMLLRTLLRPAQAGGVSPAAAMSVALAGTLGVGNIVGVASAIALGGPGAVFWMWVAALCAMVLKYAEITLALVYRRRDADGRLRGGAMPYIAAAFGRAGGWMAAVFALLCLGNAMTMGSVIQVRAASSALEAVAGIAPWAVGLTMAAAVLLAVRRGIGGVSALTGWLVPIASAAYVAVSLLALWRLRDGIGDAFAAIFADALCPESTAGGVLGFLGARGLRYGVMRGLLSNEAGCGTAPAAHAESSATRGAEQGVWGIVEVFVDTILLCTMTALVILASGVDCAVGVADGMRLTLRAYEAALGPVAGVFLAAAVAVFAYATILCWAHYGLGCVGWFGAGKGRRAAFLLAYTASICLGAVAAPDAVWTAADAALGMMTLINLVALCILLPTVRRETAALISTAGRSP